MKTHTIHEAKTNLSKLIKEACEGEEVIISRGDKPVVKLVPIGWRRDLANLGVLRAKFRGRPMHLIR